MHNKIFNYLNLILNMKKVAKSFDIVTIGSAVVDIFLNTNAYEKNNLMCYQVGSKIIVNNLRMDVGGGGVNTSIAFSRLGFNTGFIGKVSNDFYGKEILQKIDAEKIKFLGGISKKGNTGCSFILDSKEHDRTVLTYRGVNDQLIFNDFKLNNFETKWVHFASLLKGSFKTFEKLAFIFSKRGVKISFNPSNYLIEKESLNSILKIVDVLVLNKEEAQKLSKKPNSNIKDILKILYAFGPKIVVITDSKNPVYAYDGLKIYSLVPHKVKCVERTGAGDAFVSGFVAGQILGWSIEKSLDLGLKESESVIKSVGGKNNLLKMKLK